MVVDDDLHARDLLTASMRREGYRVVAATSGDAALALARQWRPDVITLDVLMPRMDGWAVLTALKSDPELAQIPVVIVTVLADRGIAISLGAAEFLTKPVDRARLAATIRHHVYGSGVVLVVDDEEESRQLVRRHLDRLGWQVRRGGGRPRCTALASAQLAPGDDPARYSNARLEWLRLSRRTGAVRGMARHPGRILTAMPLDATERELLAGRTREIIAKGADDLTQALRRVLARLPTAAAVTAAE